MTHNEVLSSTEDTLDAAPDDDSAFSLWARGGGVREEDRGVGALHDALDVGAVTTDDEQMVLGRYLQVHVDHQAGLQTRSTGCVSDINHNPAGKGAGGGGPHA